MKKGFKVGFIGSGGTGKTSVLEHTHIKLLGLKKVSSVVRGVFEKHNLTEGDQMTRTPQENWELQKEIFDAKVKQDLELREENTIAERTLLDHLSYCQYRAAGIIPPSTYQAMEKLTLENLEKYDLLFFFPIYPHLIPADDGFRQQGLGYRMAIEFLQRGFLHKYLERLETRGIEPYEVDDSGIDDRARNIALLINLKRGGAGLPTGVRGE